MKSDKRGFTLIELLVVIAIIGLLASIVLASLNSARKKSRDARREADLKQIQNAMELYANDNGGLYPNDTTANGAAISGLVGKGLSSSFIQSIPDDPAGSGAHYYWRSDATAGSSQYCLGTHLENTPLPPGASATCGNGLVLGNTVNYAIGN